MKHEIKIPAGCNVKFSIENGMAITEIEGCETIKLGENSVDEPKFKENDIVYLNSVQSVMIFDHLDDSDVIHTKCFYSTLQNKLSTKTINVCGKMRLATESEKQLLYDKLKERCLMFDGENVVRWRAEPDNIYYGVDSDGVMNDEESCDVLDDIRYKNGNYFPTYKMADAFQKQYIELLNNFHKNL